MTRSRNPAVFSSANFNPLSTRSSCQHSSPSRLWRGIASAHLSQTANTTPAWTHPSEMSFPPRPSDLATRLFKYDYALFSSNNQHTYYLLCWLLPLIQDIFQGRDQPWRLSNGFADPNFAIRQEGRGFENEMSGACQQQQQRMDRHLGAELNNKLFANKKIVGKEGGKNCSSERQYFHSLDCSCS